MVNERLNKTQVPCGTNLFDLWGGNEDCGCGHFAIKAHEDNPINVTESQKQLEAEENRLY